MSILKRKIRLLPATDELEDNDYFEVKKEETVSTSTLESQSTIPCRKSKSQKLRVTEESPAMHLIQEGSSNIITGAKIIRNYAKALCAFAHSTMAMPYLVSIMDKNFTSNQEIEGFKKFIKQKKRNIGSIESLKVLLIVKSNDTKKEQIYKELFSEISVVFLKFFAVNWLFSGKVKHRLEHLKYRHKMLRRVQNPELFTFLKGSLRKK